MHTSLAQLLYGLIPILGPNERNGDCRPEAARMAFGPNLAPAISLTPGRIYRVDMKLTYRMDIPGQQCQTPLQDT